MIKIVNRQKKNVKKSDYILLTFKIFCTKVEHKNSYVSSVVWVYHTSLSYNVKPKNVLFQIALFILFKNVLSPRLCCFLTVILSQMTFLKRIVREYSLHLYKKKHPPKNPGDYSSILEVLFKLFKLSESNDLCNIYALGSLL